MLDCKLHTLTRKQFWTDLATLLHCRTVTHSFAPICKSLHTGGSRFCLRQRFNFKSRSSSPTSSKSHYQLCKIEWKQKICIWAVKENNMNQKLHVAGVLRKRLFLSKSRRRSRRRRRKWGKVFAGARTSPPSPLLLLPLLQYLHLLYFAHHCLCCYSSFKHCWWCSWRPCNAMVAVLWVAFWYFGRRGSVVVCWGHL